MDELNFTTQNALLHYGRKGMKWYKNIFGDDDNDRGFKTIRKSKIAQQPRQREKNITSYPNTFEGQRQKMTDDYNRSAAYSNASFERKVEDTYNEEMDKRTDGVLKQVDDTVQRIQGIADNLDKFVDAFDSIQDMDDKYTEKLMNKYAPKIREYYNDFNREIGIFANHIYKITGDKEMANAINDKYRLAHSIESGMKGEHVRTAMMDYLKKKEKFMVFLDNFVSGLSSYRNDGLAVNPNYAGEYNKYNKTKE